MSNIVKTGAIPLKMNTKDIAKVTGKEHKQVLRDTRVMLVTLFGGVHVDAVIPADKVNQRGQFIWDNADALFRAVFVDKVILHHEQNQGFTLHWDNRDYLALVELNRNLTLTLAAGYDVLLRNRVISRLEELEAQQSAPLPAPDKAASQSGLPEFRRARALDLATKTAERIVAQFPSLSEQSRQVVFAKVINPVAGTEILALPHVEHKTYPAEKVGEMLGITSNMVGRIANAHGLKTDQYGMYLLDKSPHSVKQVQTFVYNDAGIEAIKFHLDAEKLTQPTPARRLARPATKAPAPEPQGALL